MYPYETKDLILKSILMTRKVRTNHENDSMKTDSLAGITNISSDSSKSIISLNDVIRQHVSFFILLKRLGIIGKVV